MTLDTDKPVWRVIGASIQGAGHQRNNVVNQDALAYHQQDEERCLSVLVVSDGHGSSKCFRSHTGAKLAVEIALSVLLETFEHECDAYETASGESARETDLQQLLVQDWCQAIELDLSQNPITEEEWSHLRNKDGEAACEAVRSNKLLAYGATLLGVVVTNAYILYLQLGDGDILCVDAAGQVTRPIARDERMIANETTSLCMKNAASQMRTAVVALEQDSPSLILASTDGYSNSYLDDTEFLKLGLDYLHMIQSEGLDAIEQKLPSFLRDTSKHGSGDDISLGMIKRIDETDVDATLLRLTKVERMAIEGRQLLNQLSSTCKQLSAEHETLAATVARATDRPGVIADGVGRLKNAEQILPQHLDLRHDIDDLRRALQRTRLMAVVAVIVAIITSIPVAYLAARVLGSGADKIQLNDKPAASAFSSSHRPAHPKSNKESLR